jgi:hypothetical protein
MLPHTGAWQDGLKSLRCGNQHVWRTKSLTPTNLNLSVSMTNLNGKPQTHSPERKPLHHVTVKSPQRRNIKNRNPLLLPSPNKVRKNRKQNSLGFAAPGRRNQKNIFTLQNRRNSPNLRKSRLRKPQINQSPLHPLSQQPKDIINQQQARPFLLGCLQILTNRFTNKTEHTNPSFNQKTHHPNRRLPKAFKISPPKSEQTFFRKRK